MIIKKLLTFLIGFVGLIILVAFFIFYANNNNYGIFGQNSGNKVQAIVSSQKLATEAGFEMLEAGGTTADAAVATAAVLSVVEPWFSSALGGGTWALYYDAKTGEVVSLDGVGPVGSLASVEDYSARANTPGIHQSNVPGSWDAWMILLEKYGKLDLDKVLEPSIRIAKQGYPVTQDMKNWLNRLEKDILKRPSALAIYAPNGKFLKVGETVYQHNMAKTFENLATAYSGKKQTGAGRVASIQAARDYYYRGPLAEAIVKYSNDFGGYLTIKDFNDFKAKIVKPISIKYNDQITVFENPPNSQGIVILLALNILKDYDFSNSSVNDYDVIHKQVEALKLSFADRYYYIGDPERINIPIDKLLSDSYAQDQRERINMKKSMSWPIEPGLSENTQTLKADHTTTFHITDKNGNAIAVTTSLGAEFLVIGDTGIHINNRMRMISLGEDDPNRLTPGYKVRHTSNPYMALKNGEPYILGGNTGVDTQPQGQLQQFMAVVEFGLTAQEAINKPRFVSTAFPAGTYPFAVSDSLQMENGFPQETISELRSLGHNIAIGSGIYGSANMLVVAADGKSVQVGGETRTSSYGRTIQP